MSSADETIRSLREAVRVSPDNTPLRQHLARTLLGLGRFAEAEIEIRQALALAPESQELKIDLANAYFQQEKISQALVVLEDVARRPESPGRAHVLYAYLLLRTGDVPGAVAQYKLGIETDPDAGDAELAERL